MKNVKRVGPAAAGVVMAGYAAQLDLYPDQGRTVVILTNQDQAMQPAMSHSRDLLTR